MAIAHSRRQRGIIRGRWQRCLLEVLDLNHGSSCLQLSQFRSGRKAAEWSVVLRAGGRGRENERDREGDGATAIYDWAAFCLSTRMHRLHQCTCYDE